LFDEKLMIIGMKMISEKIRNSSSKNLKPGCHSEFTLMAKAS